MSQNYTGLGRDGMRYWGSRKEPMQFTIIVNDMKDVLKHKATYPPMQDVLLTSSLADGAAKLGGYYD